MHMMMNRDLDRLNDTMSMLQGDEDSMAKVGSSQMYSKAVWLLFVPYTLLSAQPQLVWLALS
jgi:hypothetical protein